MYYNKIIIILIYMYYDKIIIIIIYIYNNINNNNTIKYIRENNKRQKNRK